MKDLTVFAHGPINDMFLAINLYVSTGDHVGEGIASPRGKDGLTVFILYNPRELEDADDFARFKSRLNEIKAASGIEIKTFPEMPAGQFTGFTFEIDKRDLQQFAALLIKSGGKAGYGSMYQLINDNFADALAKISSGEGS